MHDNICSHVECKVLALTPKSAVAVNYTTSVSLVDNMHIPGLLAALIVERVDRSIDYGFFSFSRNSVSPNYRTRDFEFLCTFFLFHPRDYYKLRATFGNTFR